jgi:protein-tyrosine phosphatase
MLNQIRQWGSLAFAHVKTFGHKLTVGSEPATRISATHKPPQTSSTWYARGWDSVRAYCQNPTLVLSAPHFPQIYIGSGLNAATETTYSDLGIDCILNCAHALPAFFKNKVALYQHLDMVDDAGGYIDLVQDAAFRSSLYKFLHQLYDDAIDREQKGDPPRKLLIHCVFGRSRSVAITVLVLFLWSHFENTPKSMQQIYKDLHGLRPVISMNRVFYDGLAEFEREFTHNKSFQNAWLQVFTSLPVGLEH